MNERVKLPRAATAVVAAAALALVGAACSNQETVKQTITIRFRGKLAGDNIKGKSEIEYGGKMSVGNWEATRSRE